MESPFSATKYRSFRTRLLLPEEWLMFTVTLESGNTGGLGSSGGVQAFKANTDPAAIRATTQNLPCIKYRFMFMSYRSNKDSLIAVFVA